MGIIGTFLPPPKPFSTENWPASTVCAHPPERVLRPPLCRTMGRRGCWARSVWRCIRTRSVRRHLRGQFVREALLCQYIPPPPSDVDTSIPEPSASARTLRERVAVHLEDQFCAGCHRLTDPIGLGFEQFDGLGHYRTREEGAEIDPSGELDESPFSDVGALRSNCTIRLTACLTRT